VSLAHTVVTDTLVTSQPWVRSKDFKRFVIWRLYRKTDRLQSFWDSGGPQQCAPDPHFGKEAIDL